MARFITIVVLLPFFYLAAVMAASEWGGEVIELETYDVNGRKFTTSLWIVDLDRQPWLRASDPESAWVQRLQIAPEVFVTRAGQRLAYQAEVVEDFADEINRVMREKYGLADQLIAPTRDPDQVLGIRLVEIDP